MNAREVVYTISPSADSTVVLEVKKAGWMKNKKHHLFFEQFAGQLRYFPEEPELSEVTFSVEANSATCRDMWLKPAQSRQVSEYARKALNASAFPSLTFSSTGISRKPLRGFNVDGRVTVRGVSRPMRVNAVLTEMSRGALQIDGDATFRLSDFGIKPPEDYLGLIKTQDEVLLRLLVWGTLQSSGLHGGDGDQ